MNPIHPASTSEVHADSEWRLLRNPFKEKNDVYISVGLLSKLVYISILRNKIYTNHLSNLWRISLICVNISESSPKKIPNFTESYLCLIFWMRIHFIFNFAITLFKYFRIRSTLIPRKVVIIIHLTLSLYPLAVTKFQQAIKQSKLPFCTTPKS